MITQAFRNNAISLTALYTPLVINLGVFLTWKWAALHSPGTIAFLQTHFMTSVEHLENGQYAGILASAFSHEGSM